jgi:hypothetical protein
VTEQIRLFMATMSPNGRSIDCGVTSNAPKLLKEYRDFLSESFLKPENLP